MNALSSDAGRLAAVCVAVAVASGGAYVLTDLAMGPGEPPPPPVDVAVDVGEDDRRDRGDDRDDRRDRDDRDDRRGDRDDRGGDRDGRGDGRNDRGPERNGGPPGATRVQPSEQPIFEFWEDEHFPFLGFEPEVATAAEVRASRPTAARTQPPDDMILIPAGPAIIGDATLPGSRPVRTVHVPAFQIDRYEVTNGRYRDFLRATGRKVPYIHENWAAIYNWTGPGASGAAGAPADYPPGLADVPVVMVTWKDADAYCRWAQRRLPTELEWEKAARGPAGLRYPWGAVWDSRLANVVTRLSGPLRTEAEWDAFEAAWTGSKRPEIYAVGGYPRDRSPYGLMDVAGNVSEWVAGTFVAYPGAPPGDRVKLGTPLRVARGNSWGNRDYSTPLAIRYPYEESRVDSVIGFRCALDAR